MNQGLYFGQVVIGPAGSGKVLITLRSLPTARSCKKWQKLSSAIS